ncbi:MAG: hypothetical protein ABIR34_10330 [Marmoricola sp.]
MKNVTWMVSTRHEDRHSLQGRGPLPMRIIRPVPRMYSSSPRMSKETWLRELRGGKDVVLWSASHEAHEVAQPVAELEPQVVS